MMRGEPTVDRASKAVASLRKTANEAKGQYNCYVVVDDVLAVLEEIRALRARNACLFREMQGTLFEVA